MELFNSNESIKNAIFRNDSYYVFFNSAIAGMAVPKVPITVKTIYIDGSWSQLTCLRQKGNLDPQCVIKITEKNRSRSFKLKFFQYGYSIPIFFHNYRIFGSVFEKGFLLELVVECTEEDLKYANTNLNPECAIRYVIDSGRLTAKEVTVNWFNGQYFNSKSHPVEEITPIP